MGRASRLKRERRARRAASGNGAPIIVTPGPDGRLTVTEPLDVRPAPQDGRAPDLHLVEGPDGRDTFVLGPGIEERARSGDPVALALVEIARLGPDGVYPSGWRVRDVFPELFAE